MPEPTHDISHLLTDEQIDELRTFAAQRETSVEEVLRDVIDRYILAETGQNN